jgi:hypothetical protein
MNELVEIRGANHAFEMRNGKLVEYALGDREARIRALGCPQDVLTRLRSKWKGAKRTQPTSAPIDLATVQGTTPAALAAASDAARRSVARRQAETISTQTTQTDAERKARAERLGKQIAADAETEKKNDGLRYQMQAAAGRVDSRDENPDRKFFLDLQLGKVRS